MLAMLIVLLVSVPLVELYLIVRVAGELGAGQTILLLVAVSVVGAWMVRRSGIGVLNQIRDRLSQGALPGNELVDGMLILLAGAFMLTPGFLTDAVGLLLLFPPSRKAVRSVLMRRYAKRVNIAEWTGVPDRRSDNPGSNRRFGSTLDAESYTKDTDDRSN